MTDFRADKASLIQTLLDSGDAMQARIDKALALHKPGRAHPSGHRFCEHCFYVVPCPTTQALEAES